MPLLTNQLFLQYRNLPADLQSEIYRVLGEKIPGDKQDGASSAIITWLTSDYNAGGGLYDLTRNYLSQLEKIPFELSNQPNITISKDIWIEVQDLSHSKVYAEHLANSYRREFQIFSYDDVRKDKMSRIQEQGISRPSLLMEVIINLYTFMPMVVFCEADKILSEHKEFESFLTPEKRKNYYDPYFKFSLDLSQLLIIFIVQDKNKLPPYIKSKMDFLDLKLNIPIERTTQASELGFVQRFDHLPSESPRELNNKLILEMMPNVLLGTSSSSIRSASASMNTNSVNTTSHEDDDLISLGETSSSSQGFSVATSPLTPTLLSEVAIEENELTFYRPLSTNSEREKVIYPFNIQRFSFDQIIDSRNGRMILKCLHEPSRKTVVLKTIQVPHSRDFTVPNDLLFEIEALKRVSNHKNIVDFHGMTKSQSNIFICMEYMDTSLTVLYRRIKEKGKSFPKKIFGAIAVSIIDALNFCYSQERIIHRDIKPDNILINRKGEIKLADFGVARILNESLAQTFAGTLNYMPPERFTSDQPYDAKADIWSLGITLLECVLGKDPYSDGSSEQMNRQASTVLRHRIATSRDFSEKGSAELLAKFPENYSIHSYNFLKLCFEKVETRPLYNELMETGFYKESKGISDEKIRLKLEQFLGNE